MTTLEPSKNSRYIVLDALGILAQSLGPIAARRLKAGGIRHFNANGRSSAVRDLPQTPRRVAGAGGDALLLE